MAPAVARVHPGFTRSAHACLKASHTPRFWGPRFRLRIRCGCVSGKPIGPVDLIFFGRYIPTCARRTAKTKQSLGCRASYLSGHVTHLDASLTGRVRWCTAASCRQCSPPAHRAAAPRPPSRCCCLGLRHCRPTHVKETQARPPLPPRRRRRSPPSERRRERDQWSGLAGAAGEVPGGARQPNLDTYCAR
jgi:hypothetical protein